MKKYEVTITDQADQDLRDIFEYLALELRSFDSAVGQLERLGASIEKLDTFPERHRLYEIEPWRSRNLHMFPIDNYVVFYIPDNEKMTVTVIRIIYGGRDIDAQLNRFTRYEE